MIMSHKIQMVIIGSKSVHTRDSSVFPDTADCKPKLENRKFKEYQQTNWTNNRSTCTVFVKCKEFENVLKIILHFMSLNHSLLLYIILLYSSVTHFYLLTWVILL